MLLASYLTGAFCVAAAGAWYLLRQFHRSESLVMLRMGLALAATLLPAQLYVGHLVGDYVHDYQPAKFAAIEGRWHDQQPASEVLIAIPNAETESSRYEVAIPVFGRKSEPDLKGGRHNQLLAAGRPPVAITFFTFRIMVGCGIIMLAVSWLGLTLSIRHALEQRRRALWCIFLSFPLPWIAIITGWYTAEVGRQPWTVYGLLRTADALTPFLTASVAATSLI
jgi:cytochrome d ubiquinol oxidase subunit I